jgi:RNA polymerase sigma-70 factor (ECF subfamily)
VEAALLDGLSDAMERGDVDRLVELVTEDVWLTMPPLPGEYQGREVVHRFFTEVAFREGRTYRTVPTRANGQPALAVYQHDPVTGVLHANGLMVLTLVPDGIAVMTRFEPAVFAAFGLPRTLDG